jgi:phosphoglycolate phosphatase
MHRVYDEFGVSRASDREILAQVGETYATFVRWLLPQGFPQDASALAARITEIEFDSIVSHGRLFDGVREGLETLRRGGLCIALCTHGDRRYAEHVLGTHGILPLFETLQTNYDDRRSKPEMVRQLLRRFRPAHAIVVGDRRHDIEAGEANGCLTVGAAYGYAGPGELDRASRTIAQFDELLPIVEDVSSTA